MLNTNELAATREALHMLKSPEGHAPPAEIAELAEPLTVSGAEMARITGVGRERLRTWERRHGFPMPVRTPNGMRRYRAEDVRVVVTVARLVDRGISLHDAIRAAHELPGAETGFESLGPALDYANSPALAVRGPMPLTVAWTNAQTITAPEAPSVGDDLVEKVPDFGPAAVSTIQRLMSGDLEGAVVVSHVDWTTSFPSKRRSLAWRLPSQATDEAVVVLMQLPDEGEHEHNGSSAAPWASAISAARGILEHESGVVSVQRALGELVTKTGAMDAFIATCHGSELRAASSVRGCWPGRVLDLARDADAWNAISDGAIDWLSEPTLRRIGAPPRSQAVVVPLLAGGHTLGGVFLFYAAELRLCDVTRELLQTFAATIATALQREHESARAARAA